METYYVVFAIYRVHWGISVRTPFGSAVQPSQKIPPPTTLAGALAWAAIKAGLLGGEDEDIEFYEQVYEQDLNRVEKLGIVSSALRAVIGLRLMWVVAGWLTPFTHLLVRVRYFSAPYRSRAGELSEIARGSRHISYLWSPLSIGYNLSPWGLLQAVFISETKEYARKIAVAAMHVSRIGSKESFVDPLWVGQCDLKPVEKKYVFSLLPLPLSYVESAEGAFTTEHMPWPLQHKEWTCWYSATPSSCEKLGLSRISVIRDILIPLPPGGVRIKPASGTVVLEASPEKCDRLLEPRQMNLKLEPVIAPARRL